MPRVRKIRKNKNYFSKLIAHPERLGYERMSRKNECGNVDNVVIECRSFFPLSDHSFGYQVFGHKKETVFIDNSLHGMRITFYKGMLSTLSTAILFLLIFSFNYLMN